MDRGAREALECAGRRVEVAQALLATVGDGSWDRDVEAARQAAEHLDWAAAVIRNAAKMIAREGARGS